jgi:hypothetical protein
VNHLVILRQPYLDLILAGVKTVESRLSCRRHPAAGRCRPGDVLYLKQAGGDVRARATVARVVEVNDIPPGGVAALAEEWGERVAGTGPDDPYWRAKRHARHALFIELANVEPVHIPAAALPRRLPWASAWIVGQPDADTVRRFAPEPPRSLV